MKYLILLIITAAILISGCKSKVNMAGVNPATTGEQTAVQADPKLKYYDQATWLLGYFSFDRLLQPPYSEWYIQEYDNYQPESEFTDKLREIPAEDISIKIVLGTWCPDSRREVPRFMRIIDVTGFPRNQIEFIGVDNVKISPIENYDALEIERVPTFIFFQNKVETGRIIETPKTSLEQDMLNILTRNEKQ